MKIKLIIFLIVSAVITVSFSYPSLKATQKETEKVAKKQVNVSEPVGGFISEDKF